MKKAKGKSAGRITKPPRVAKNNKPDGDAPKPPFKKRK
jgi:hypothetical protein